MTARLPDNRRWVQLNNSDLFGSIYRSKNINLDEEGYINLSPRSVSLINTDDDADWNIVAAFGRRGTTDQWYAAGIDDPFDIQISPSTGITVVQDTDTGNDTPPNLTEDSHGVWFNNRWHTTEDELLTWKNPSNGNWTDTAVALTTGKRHPLAVFQNRQTLCIGDGNQVLQYDDSYVASTTLTIPSGLEVTKIAYSNKVMGVATKLSDTASGQNGEAYFFIWDGGSTSASQGVSAGTDFIYDVVPYKGTFVILTRSGLGRAWNGGGWTDLFQLPVYFTPAVWGDSVNTEGYGDLMLVDGDVIYLNINNTTEQYGRKSEEYLSPGGVLCYDPKFGLYHRWSPSISPANRLTVTATNVNTSTDVLTTTAGTIPSTGSPIKYIDSSNDDIGGLTIGKVYYCIKLSSTTMQFATTRENALNGIYIDLTSQSSVTNYFLAVELRDYGATYMRRTGAVALADKPNLALDQVIFSGEYIEYDATTDLEHLCVTVREFPNIGYIITPKILSQQIQDTWQKGFVKHRPLKEGDKIIVKAQTEEYYGLPTSTPQGSSHCTWKGTDTLATSADFSEALAYLNASDNHELECEIIAGAGAGQMSQIESITYDSGTYSIVLKDSIEGVYAENVCDIFVENWKTVKTITSTDEQIAEAPVGEKSDWVKFKIIMVGADVSIYEIPVASTTHKPIA